MAAPVGPEAPPVVAEQERFAERADSSARPSFDAPVETARTVAERAPELPTIDEPVATTDPEEAVTLTVEADGGVTDVREALEANRMAEIAVAESAPEPEVAEPPPAPTAVDIRAEDRQAAAQLEEPVPDVEIPDWLRSDYRTPAAQAEVRRETRAEPVAAPISEPISQAVSEPAAEPVPESVPETRLEASAPPAEAAPAEPSWASISPSPRVADAVADVDADVDADVALSPFGPETPAQGTPFVEDETDRPEPQAVALEESPPAPHEPALSEASWSRISRDEWDREEPHAAHDASVYARDELIEWATSAATAEHPINHGDALAEALEALAQRLRRGELEAPLYHSGMSDAAALTAALAAVLGIRR